MNRKRKAENSWECECRNAIEAGDADTVREIEKKLQTLQNEAQARLIKLKQVTGMGVRMIDSNESQDGDVAYNTYERMIDAKFTAGPNAAKFSIWIRNVKERARRNLLSVLIFSTMKINNLAGITTTIFSTFLRRRV